MEDSVSDHTAAVVSREIQEWLRGCVAEYVQRSPEDVDVAMPLSEYGLDSVYLVSLAADIEDRYGIEVEPTLLWDHGAIGPIADALVPLVTSSRAA
jgi:acyl carrier protein